MYPGDVAGCYIIAERCCQVCTRGAAVLPGQAGVPCRPVCLPASACLPAPASLAKLTAVLEGNPPHKTEFQQTYDTYISINP